MSLVAGANDGVTDGEDYFLARKEEKLRDSQT